MIDRRGPQPDLPPLITVVIPAYQAEDTVAAAVQSVIDQTYGNLDIIVVDDGSTDDTAAIVASLQQKDTRLRLVRQRNEGASSARNRGIAVAKGAFVAFLDADDLWHHRKIELQLDRFRQAGPEVGLVYTWSCHVNEAGRLLLHRGFLGNWEGDIYAQLVTGNFINGTLMVRRELLLAVGGYDTRLRGNEDLDLYLRLVERCDAAVVPKCLAAYRLRPTGLSHKVWSMRRGHQATRAAARERHPELPGWLFRWSASNQLWFLAFRALRSGDVGAAVVLTGETLLRDPGFVMSPDMRAVPMGALRRLLGVRRPQPAPGPIFDPAGEPPDLPPRPRSDDWFRRWRDERVSALRIERGHRVEARSDSEDVRSPDARARRHA